jgi:hypothetical protein
MPIGLPDRGRRAADVLARAAVGPLRSSVFMTPVRAALEADDHPSAAAVNRELAGEGTRSRLSASRPNCSRLRAGSAKLATASSRFIRRSALPSWPAHLCPCVRQPGRVPNGAVTCSPMPGSHSPAISESRAVRPPLTTSSMLQWPHGRLDGSLAARPAPCQTRPRPSPTDSRARSGHDSLETIKPGR